MILNGKLTIVITMGSVLRASFGVARYSMALKELKDAMVR